MANKIKKGDIVKVIAGKDKDKEGKVLAVNMEKGTVLVEGVNMITKHVRPRREGEEGGRIQAEGAFYASKAMVVCSKCKHGVRVGHKILDDGSKVRVCKKCGTEL